MCQRGLELNLGLQSRKQLVWVQLQWLIWLSLLHSLAFAGRRTGSVSSRRVASVPGASPSEVSCRRALLTSRIRILASTCLARCWHNVSASRSQWSFLRCWSAAADSCKSSNQSPCKKRRILSENTFFPVSPFSCVGASSIRGTSVTSFHDAVLRERCHSLKATTYAFRREPRNQLGGSRTVRTGLRSSSCKSKRFPAEATLVLACTHSRAAPLARCWLCRRGVRAVWPCRLAAGARRQGLLLESHLARSAGVVAVSQGGER